MTQSPSGQIAVATDSFLALAAALLGPRGLTQDPDLLTPWLTDWRARYTGRALALAASCRSCSTTPAPQVIWRLSVSTAPILFSRLSLIHI